MKKIFCSLCLGIAAIAGAQTKEGKVVYERTMQMNMRRFGPAGDAPQLPPERKDQFELLFSGNQSLWQYLPNASEENPGVIESNSGGNRMIMRMAGVNDVAYYNFTNGTSVSQREIMERSFVVTDSIRKLSWKLSDETKTILNYTARKATAQRIGTRPMTSMENGEIKRTEIADTANIIAWFTTDIPVPAGPEYGGQLPGLILELDLNNGRMVYKAVEISTKVNVAKIKEPKEGKKVTAAEFTKERDKIFEEMRQNRGGGGRNGTFIIQQ